MNRFLYENRAYLFPYMLMLMATLALLAFIPKGDEVVWLNSLYNDKLNLFFVYATKLGEATVAVVIGLILLYAKPLRTLFGFIAVTATIGLSIYLFKNFIYPDALRPKLVLQHMHLLFVEELHINSYHSFPSGHTAAAFGVFTYISFLFKTPLKPMVLVFPFLAGLSRIYLAQHFLIDVVAGSVMGVSIAIFYYNLFHNKLGKEGSLLNKKLINK